MKRRTLDQLAKNLRQKHAQTHSWPKTSVACKVLTADGRPDPSLAQRIAEDGYEPKRTETRQRLGLAPICINCGQKVKRVRHVPAWVEQATANLSALETTANAPDANRVYSRGGKRAHFESKLQSPQLN